MQQQELDLKLLLLVHRELKFTYLNHAVVPYERESSRTMSQSRLWDSSETGNFSTIGGAQQYIAVSASV